MLATYRGKPSLRLEIEKSPADWLAALEYADWLSETNPEGATELERELYEVYPIRENVEKPHRWNYAFKQITFIRRNYLRDKIDEAGYYDQLDKEDREAIDELKEKKDNDTATAADDTGRVQRTGRAAKPSKRRASSVRRKS